MEEELRLSYYFEDMESFILPEVFKDVQYPWEALAKARDIVERVAKNSSEGIKGQVGEGCSITGEVSIGKGTILHAHVTIEGPVVIGENCNIMPGVLIRPGSVLGNNCTVGHGCEIKNSIIQNGAKVQSLTFVGDSVIGKSARIGSGTIVANRRFDQGEIGIKINGKYYKFGTDFLGCVLGDNSRVGANAVTLPGTFIGPYTWIMPLTRVGGFIPRAKRVSSTGEIVITDNQIKKLRP